MGKGKIPIIGDNKKGTKLFCVLKRDKKQFVKGYYCFTDETLYVERITKYLMEEGETKESIMKLFADEAHKEYDWDIKDIIFDHGNKRKSSGTFRRRWEKGKPNTPPNPHQSNQNPR